MAKLNTQSKTREDFHLEKWEDAAKRIDDIGPDTAATIAKNQSTALVEAENERIWAFYRDPQTDLTQVEARDRGQYFDYPPAYQISQSGVSRRVSELDDAVLSESLKLLNMRERENTDDEKAEFSFLSRWHVQKLKRNYFEEYLDKWRHTIAKFLVDAEALQQFKKHDCPTPEWAKQRFPGLDPDLGREYGSKIGKNGKTHDPTHE